MSNVTDQRYIGFLQRLSARYRENTAGKPVFTTDVDTAELWRLYLGTFTNKQYHNCNTCRGFMNRYAGLAVLNNGKVCSALWNQDDVEDDTEEHAAIRGLRAIVEEAKITGVFYSDEPQLGRLGVGGWIHFAVNNPQLFKTTVPSETAAQAMAKKREEYKNITRALKEFNPAIVKQAQALAASGSLFRAERVTGPLQWLADLQAACGDKPRANTVWLAVATAPAGYTHARSSMTGTLLKDIAASLLTDEIISRFNAKMDDYQRAQRAPKVGQINAAEQAVQELGIAPAFARRYVTTYDLATLRGRLWSPSRYEERVERHESPKTGVFGDLRPKRDETVPTLEIPPRTMTWEKFARDILPGAAVIEYKVPLVGRFCSLTTAQDPLAPPILQWDFSEARNPVAWSFPNPPATAEEWSLTPGTLVPVQLIVKSPNLWNEMGVQEQHGKGVFLLLAGARDVRDLPGGGLFTEHLRSELKPYRATIEAHLNKLHVAGATEAETMAFGIGLLQGNDWTESAAPTAAIKSVAPQAAAPDYVDVLLVIDDSGSMGSYIAAARQALRSLLDAVRSMPGKVLVTIVKFGNTSKILGTRTSLENLLYIEEELNGSSGNTALNDAIGKTIMLTEKWHEKNHSYFLGIVTDGEENNSTKYDKRAVRDLVKAVMETGQWTVALAGAGRNPWEYANAIGIPEGNFTKFEASARGFEEVGARYAASTRGLATAYKSGARASTSFFSAVSGRKPIGTDYPVLVVTSKSGQKSAYKLDRWE